MAEILWTDYFRFRAETRGYDLDVLTQVIRFSSERYLDTVTGRTVVVGRHKGDLVMVACDIADTTITPVTVHETSRRQIRFRLNTGRFSYE